VWGRKTLATTTKERKNDYFYFFSNVTNRGYCTTGRGDKINERKQTKETQRKDSRKTSQRKK
jgi:hypothetical protein